MGEGLVVGTSIAKAIFGFGAAEAENQALETEKLETEVAANDQTIQRQRSLKKVIGAQITNSAASGIETSSASLQAIKVDTYNQAAEDQELSNLELDVENENIEQKKRNNKAKAWTGAFDDLFGAAKFFTGLPDTGATPGKFDVFGDSSSQTQVFSEKTKSKSGVEL